MCDEDDWPSIDQWIHDSFPNLRNGGYEETSGRTCLYNCIAWAAGDTEKWWWPSEDAYWPEGLSRDDESVDNFKLAFKQELNYESCEDGSLEQGFEKVVIYAVAGRTKHMARQTVSGAWTSKLGRGWDIVHQTLEGVECNAYGQAVTFMKRPRINAGVENEKTTPREGCIGGILRAFRRVG